MKRVVRVAFIAFALMSLALTPALAQNAGLSGKITYMVWGNQASNDIEQRVIDAFLAH